MADCHDPGADDAQTRQRFIEYRQPQHIPGAQPSFMDGASYSYSQHGYRHASGQGNSSMRASTLEMIQHTHGNRATQRFIQRSKDTAATAVQRQPEIVMPEEVIHGTPPGTIVMPEEHIYASPPDTIEMPEEHIYASPPDTIEMPEEIIQGTPPGQIEMPEETIYGTPPGEIMMPEEHIYGTPPGMIEMPEETIYGST